MGSFATNNITDFVANCGASVTPKACACPQSLASPWLTVNFTDTSSSAPTTEFGAFTVVHSALAATASSPRRKPCYVIEGHPRHRRPWRCLHWRPSQIRLPRHSHGFGLRDDIQAVMQMIFRKQQINWTTYHGTKLHPTPLPRAMPFTRPFLPWLCCPFIPLVMSRHPILPPIPLAADPCMRKGPGKTHLTLALSVEFPTVGAQYRGSYNITETYPVTSTQKSAIRTIKHLH